MLSIAVIFASRAPLVLLLLPFSALEKIPNFDAAVDQAEQDVKNQTLARLLIFIGLGVEVVMSLGIFTGIADRFGAFTSRQTSRRSGSLPHPAVGC